MRGLQKVFTPPVVPEGDGASVRRAVGAQALQRLDPFLVLDHFYVAKPHGFPAHPHRGFETVTYMLQGTCVHEDFRGHAGTIGPGAVQWMTAGKGIVHTEMPGTEQMEGLQLWVNLKREHKMCDPQYQELEANRVVKATQSGVAAAVIAGEAFGATANTTTRTPMMYIDFEMQRDSQVTQLIPSGWNGLLYVLEGNVQVLGDVVAKHQVGVLSDQEGQLTVVAKDPARFVLIAGEPICEPVVQRGPFVMNESAELEEALNDYKQGLSGFEGAPEWRSR